MKDPINPELEGFILDVARLKALIQNMPDDAEIYIRTKSGDTSILMNELEVYLSDEPNQLPASALIFDLSRVGDTFRELLEDMGVKPKDFELE